LLKDVFVNAHPTFDLVLLVTSSFLEEELPFQVKHDLVLFIDVSTFVN